MLILTRRVGETLMIGDDVKVTVLGVKGNQVRIGINAPKDVSVHRQEIYQRILKEKVDKQNETQVQQKKKETWKQKLSTLMRRDPDYVLTREGNWKASDTV